MNTSIKQYLKKHGFREFHPKAVLFDMDGVIYDSMPNHAYSWNKAMASFGIDMPPEEAYLYEGMRGVETIKLKARQQWQRELSDEEAQHMYHTKTQLFAQCPPAKKMEGIVGLMEQIRDDGLKICVVTGSGQHSLLDKLEEDLHGLVHKDLIVTSFDVEHGKPSPEPYLAGMRKAGVEPWESIVVENAPLGVRAAVAARCYTVAVNTGPLPNKTLSQEGASRVLRNIEVLRRKWPDILHGMSPSHHTHEERWQHQYEEVMSHLRDNKRSPSKYIVEERLMYHWVKHNKRKMAHGELSEERTALFETLLQECKRWQRLNQYAYVNPDSDSKQRIPTEIELHFDD